MHELSDDEINELWNKEESHEAPYEYFAREHKYSYNTLTVGIGRWNYKGLVEAIIRDKYSSDEMEAITNNMNAIVGEFFNVLVTEGIIGATKYLLESIQNENSENFKQMQQWRALAKKEARSLLKM